MNTRTAGVALLALILGVAGFFFYRDYQYRQVHGRVTQVGLTTWDQEVERVKDAQPVLVYFYKENDKNPPDAAQNDEVADFAWNNAGKVKVVSVNVAFVENIPLAIILGGLRQPAFAIVYGDDVVLGPSGGLAREEDLARLLHNATLPKSKPQARPQTQP